MLTHVPRRVPGEVLLHPVAIAAVTVLIVNDHFLKQRDPGVITGKLSDFAGLVFFPLLVCSLCERARRAAGVASWSLSSGAFATAIFATAVAFAAVKLSVDVASGYSSVLGILDWPTRAVTAVVRGHAVPGPRPVRVLADPTDLVALPAVLVAWWVSARCRVVTARAGPRPSARR